MNKKAIFGVLLAIVIPFMGYYMVKHYSDQAVHMPGRYFYDSVIVKEKNGRPSTDTIWHTVKDMTFTNQLGKTVTLDSLNGKILVIDFFFSRCPTICPEMAKSMKRLQNSFINSNDSIVQFISVSIDPVHDSVPQLRKFADRFTNNHDSWWFVTGDKKAFIHTENFFLLDRDRVVRGWYDGLDTLKQAKLVRDIPLLMLEKKKKRSFKEFLEELFGRS